MLSVWHRFVSLFLPSFKRDFRLKKEAIALRGGGKRLAVRAVKAAGLAFIGAKRRALTEQAAVGAGLRRKGVSERFREGGRDKKWAAPTRRGPHKLSGLFYLVVLTFVGSRRPDRVFGEVLLLVSPPFVFLFLVKSARTAAATLPTSIL